jgi:hypothetical protein
MTLHGANSYENIFLFFGCTIVSIQHWTFFYRTHCIFFDDDISKSLWIICHIVCPDSFAAHTFFLPKVWAPTTKYPPFISSEQNPPAEIGHFIINNIMMLSYQIPDSDEATLWRGLCYTYTAMWNVLGHLTLTNSTSYPTASHCSSSSFKIPKKGLWFALRSLHDNKNLYNIMAHELRHGSKF